MAYPFTLPATFTPGPRKDLARWLRQYRRHLGLVAFTVGRRAENRIYQGNAAHFITAAETPRRTRYVTAEITPF